MHFMLHTMQLGLPVFQNSRGTDKGGIYLGEKKEGGEKKEKKKPSGFTSEFPQPRFPPFHGDNECITNAARFPKDGSMPRPTRLHPRGSPHGAQSRHPSV